MGRGVRFLLTDRFADLAAVSLLSKGMAKAQFAMLFDQRPRQAMPGRVVQPTGRVRNSRHSQDPLKSFGPIEPHRRLRANVDGAGRGEPRRQHDHD